MNYVRHLNAFFSFIRSDGRLTSSHVSLYMALFQYWNFNRFQNPFPVYRDNIMNLSKIGSKNTYHKCVKELHEAKYIYYQPSPSRFLPVRISVIRLDIPAEEPTRYKQLDLFNSESSQATSTDIDTGSVPHLTDTSTDFDTVPVPNLGHNIKPNFKEDKTVSDTPIKNFNKNGKNKDKLTGQPGVPNLGHDTERSPSTMVLTQSEVEEFFISANYPVTEAQKFFLYNKGRGWQLRDKVPIKDWQALAHKWMLGIGKTNSKKKQSEEAGPDAEELFNQFSAGQKIFYLITAEHFQQLQLKLTEPIMQEAWKERINQLTGTNQHSLNQLWDAYLKGNKENELIKKDGSNLINLAKRIAVLKHFQKQNLSS